MRSLLPIGERRDFAIGFFGFCALAVAFSLVPGIRDNYNTQLTYGCAFCGGNLLVLAVAFVAKRRGLMGGILWGWVLAVILALAFGFFPR